MHRFRLLSLCLFILAGCRVHAQISQTTFTVLPATSTSTGAPTATGFIYFRDLSTPPHTIGIRAPISVSSSYTVTLPDAPAAGCLKMDTMGNMSVDSTCTGTTGTGVWSLDSSNNVYLNSTSYTVKSLPIEDQTASTGSTNETITAGAGQSGDLFDINTNAGAHMLQVDSAGNLDVTEFIEFHSGSSLTWSIDGSSGLNILDFRDSSSTLRMYLDASGTPTVGGSGVDVVTPSVFTEATTNDSPSMVVAQFGGSTVDIFRVQNSGATKELWVDDTGVTHIASCSGCTSSPFPDSTAILENNTDHTKLLKFALAAFPTSTTYTLTPQNANYVMAGTNITNQFSANQIMVQGYFLQFAPSGSTTMTWQMNACGANEVCWYNSGSTLRMYLQDNGAPVIGGSGADLVAPSIYTQPTSANSPALMAVGAASQSADIFDVYSNNLVSHYLWVDSSGGTHIANCAAGCTTGVTSVTATSPIASSGGTTPVISCSTCPTSSLSATSPIGYSGGVISCANCDTTNTAQTISATKTFTASQTFGTTFTVSMNASSQEIQPSSAAAWVIGDSTHPFGGVYSEGLELTTGSTTQLNALVSLADVQPSPTNSWTLGDSSHLWSAVYANGYYIGSTNVINSSGQLVGSGGVNTSGNINTSGGSFESGGVAGVSCTYSSAPTSSLVISHGIVTHC